MHCNTLKQDNDSTVRGDGGSRVGEVRAGTTSPMPEHKGFKLHSPGQKPRFWAEPRFVVCAMFFDGFTLFRGC